MGVIRPCFFTASHLPSVFSAFVFVGRPVVVLTPALTKTTRRDVGQRDTMEAAAEAAQAQFSNMEAAMRQQLSQFRANASSDGSLTDDVMGQPPPPARPPARWLRTPK